ncbi:MAG: type I-C CRISPR-associated protein Cas8c/Csd1 [bacterium]
MNMILQALNQYYDRLKEDPESGVPLSGFSREKFSFELVIDNNGNLLQVADIRGSSQKGKQIPKLLVVPQGTKKSVNISANFLWGNTGYVLGIDSKGKQKRTVETFIDFKKLAHEIGDNINDLEMEAVLKFLDNWNPDDPKSQSMIKDAIDANLVFRIDGYLSYVHENKLVKEAWLKHFSQKKSEFVGECLITGKKKEITRLHPAIKGVRGAQSSGANIVNFNLDSFCSYSKSQGFNAPVSEEATFAYTTALNYLLSMDSRKVQIGDATTVFWSEKPSVLENFLSEIFNPTQEDANIVEDVRRFLEAVSTGNMPKAIDGTTKFYILGLSPNASRLSVRFWYEGTVEEVSKSIGKHFQDIAIEKQSEKDKEFPGLWHLLVQTAVLGKTDNINPLLSGELARSILTQWHYPECMLSALIGRIRAGEKINYLRSAMIKGILVRNHGKEVSMSLDKSNKEPAYLLGRLFAVLEKAQQDALGDINATIKDRYYSSASATPLSTFPILLRLNKHHTSKGEHGGFYDSLNAEILEQLPAQKFPSHFTLEEQGLFAIGYYHQRNDFYKKKETKHEG